MADFTMETIGKNSVVTFRYVLKDESGTELEASEPGAPMLYLHGHRNLISGLEEVMAGKSAADEFSVTVTPEKAYGFRRDDAVQRVPIKHLATKARRYQTGMIVQVNTRQGPKQVTILKVGKFNVDVDFNHPFAGRTLVFDVSIESVREATAEELAHGHAHGPAGHDH